MLLEAGANPTDERDGLHGNEVLYHACEFPDPTCARLVIEAGPRQSFIDYDLGRALNFHNPEMIEMFCTHGARAHAGHLHQAVWRRRPARTVAALLDAGAPIDAPDEHGLTPLQVAELWGEDEVAGCCASAAPTRRRSPRGPCDRRCLSGRTGCRRRRAPVLDEMLILAIQGGHLETMRRLLDAGARIDGDPDGEDDPARQACWRGRVRDRAGARGSAARRSASVMAAAPIGAALHGSRHCQDPEGGPTMRTVDEIPTEPYAEIVRILLAAGATVPDRFGEHGRPRDDAHRRARRRSPGVTGRAAASPRSQTIAGDVLRTRCLRGWCEVHSAMVLPCSSLAMCQTLSIRMMTRLDRHMLWSAPAL